MNRRRGLALLALLCASAATWHFAAAPPAPAQVTSVVSDGQVARGGQLFGEACASCHGFQGRGRRGRGPSLRGVGARAADFYLSTGRMPLADPHDPPTRTRPAYPRDEIEALTAYVGSLGGPGVPRVDVDAGRLGRGRMQFTEHCAGCHQELARGGIVTGAVAPSLQTATPVQIAEAIRVGPYLMPAFSERQIDQATIDDIARYVVWTRHPSDRGGWGIGHIGPIPEGMIAWLLAVIALLVVARLIGERTPT